MGITTDTISVVSRKGGTGKTTTAFNLAYSLVELGGNVLLIDLDSQQNLTDTVNLVEEVDYTIHDVIKERAKPREAIFKTDIRSIDLIPAAIELADLEVELSDIEDKEEILAEKLQPLKGEYDYIIIDTAPSLDSLVINSLVASDYALVTVRTSLYSFKGIDQVMEIIELIQNSLNPELEILGLLVTQVDSRTNVSTEFIEDLKEIYEDKVFDTIINKNVALVESVLEGLPCYLYDSNAKGSKQYMQLAKEVRKGVMLNG
mgnify:CR=1 FL=1